MQNKGYESNFELIMLRNNFEITVIFFNFGKKFRFRTSTKAGWLGLFGWSWGEAGGGRGVWGEGVKWVVKGFGVRWVEGVDVHV